MDVTNGLISRLVKSKSTERVLAPIASQVSLLMILNEVEGEESADGSALNIAVCVERVTQAVNGFIHVGQDHIHHSLDPLFNNQMSSACETLELAKSELYVAGQNLSGSPDSPHAHSSLVTAAKDMLQAVLRVLIVVDDVEVRRCVQAVTVVEKRIDNIGCISDARNLVPAFKELTEAVLYMTMMMSRRQKDLISRSQGQELMTALNLIRKGVSSLRMAVQTHLKYPSNPQALVGKQQVLAQIKSILADMRTTLESGPPSDLDTEEPGHFVDHIDKVLENLREGNRFDLNPDIESWVASIIRHAMGVALLCQGSYRHIITRICQRILQSKFRLFELQVSVSQSPHLPEIRLDYEGVCEVLLDEFCEVEKHVNMALLNLIIDTCCFTSQPLEQLAFAAIHDKDALGPDVSRSSLAEDFISHGDKLCQVAGMASASSMDPKKVRAVILTASRLEQLIPDVVPAVAAVARHPGTVATVRQLKALVQEWEAETQMLVKALDSMTDPVVFLQVTEQRMRQAVNVLRGNLSSKDGGSAGLGLRKLLAHAQRMAQVATHVVDTHSDPLFRNGLMVFVKQIESARQSVKDAGRSALEDLSHSRVLDTLHRRLGLLLDAAADLRQGMKPENHVDILHPARQNVRRQYLLSDKPSRGERVAQAKNIADGKQETVTSLKTQSAAGGDSKGRSAFLNGSENIPADSLATLDDAKAIGKGSGDTVVVSKGSAQKQGSKGKNHGSPSSKGLKRQKGETSLFLQSCIDGLLASAKEGNGASVARWIGDVLGWTSHLGEVAISLLDHCHHAARKSEMRQLTIEVDRLAPLVIEAARFLSAGEKNQLNTLRNRADDWVNACNKLRILVDVASSDWLLLVEDILQTVNSQDTDQLKSLLAILDRNHREMNQLLSRSRSLEGHHMTRGKQIVEFLQESHLELDSLTATLKTTADCINFTGDQNAVNRTQLIQRGREWGALMTCLVEELDFVADSLSASGQAALGVPAISATQASGFRSYVHLHSRVVPVLQAETSRLKDCLTSLSAGRDDAVKKRSDELLQGLEDIIAEILEIANTPVDDATLPQAQLFARLDAGLARSRWTEKALESEQFIQRHCLKFCTLVNNLLYSAGFESDGVPVEVSRLQSTMKTVTQRTLQALQLSADLQQRATVRRCLDELTNLLPSVTQAATDYAAGLDREKNERAVQKAGTQWGAKVHLLLTVLRSMADIKPTVVNELERQLSAHPTELAPAPGATTNTNNTSTATAHPPWPVSQQQFPTASPINPTARLASNPSGVSFPASHARKTSNIASSPRSEKNSSLKNNSAPVLSSRSGFLQASPVNLSQSSPDVRSASAVSEMSPYRRSALYSSWLASAQYLGEEVAGWEDSDNHFVHLVHNMAQHCHHMADFARGGTSMKDSEEVASTGVALAADGKELETFARSLMAMAPHNRKFDELGKAAERISTYARQLHIVASVLQNGPGNPEGDCILARNAANLIDAVRDMFSIAEGVSVAGCIEPREGNETDRQVVDLLTRWQQKLATYRLQQANIPLVDDLGLRRMEVHNPPSLTTLVDG